MADTLVNPNANYFNPGQPGNPTISSSTLTQQPTITLPPPPPVNTGTSTNASVPSTVGAIVQSAYQPTATENQQSDFSKQLSELIGGEKSLATQQTGSESQAGIPALAKAQNDLTTQLSGLNDQATALQNEANYTIPNQAQESATGRGITVGGLAPLTASQLRQNQIKQGAISSQALTVKSALYAAQGNYTLAKDAADKAAQVAFDADEQNIKYKQAQLAAIQPTLDKDQAARAALLSATLQDRKTQIDNQREDFKTGQGLAILAMKNNPNNPQAQYAAQQALKLDPSDPQYLQKVSNMVGQYQQDPQSIQKAIDEHLLNQAQIKLANANAAKINNEAKTAQPIIPTRQNAPYINAFNNATAGLGSQTSTIANKTFASILAGGDLNQAKTYIIRTALQNAPADQQNQAIGRSQALGAMNDISSLLGQAQQKGVNTNLLTGSLTNVANSLGTSNNPDLNYIGSRILQALITYRKGMTGVAFGPQEAADYKKIFPDITNISNLNTAKIQALQDSLNANNKATLGFLIGDQNYDSLFGSGNTATLPSNKTSGQTVQSNGQTYQVGTVYNDGTANWTVDAQGKWTKK